MYDKRAISAYILEIVKKGPYLTFQTRAKEDLIMNRHQFFCSFSLFSLLKRYWLIPLIVGEAVFRSENFKSTFAIFLNNLFLM